MALSKNEKVEGYLNNLKKIEPLRIKTLLKIRKIFLDTFPQLGERIMYGGIVFFMDEDLISGIFVSKNHITIEFGRGYQMNDPDQLLEGKGKYRRHLKIKSREDVAGKRVAYFVKQAVDE